MAAQYSAGTPRFDRPSQYESVDCLTPIFSARACWLPATETARDNGVSFVLMSRTITISRSLASDISLGHVVSGIGSVPAMGMLAGRLKEAREAAGLSQADLAERVGMKQTGIASIEAGEVARPRKMREISRAVGRSEEWLLGEEPADRDSDIQRVPDDIPEGKLLVPEGAIIELDVRAGMGGGGEVQMAYVRNGQEVTTVDAVKPEAWLLPRAFVREQLRAPASSVVVLETQGDSMSPTINPGERVFVDTGHRIPSPDGIYAIRDRFGGIVVKRLQVNHGGGTARITVISDNPSHKPNDVGLDEIEIIGKVVASIKTH